MKFIKCILLFATFTTVQSFVPIIPKKTNKLKAVPETIATSIAFNTAIATTAQIKGQKSLTLDGLVNSWILGNILWTTNGFEAWSTCALYFLIGNTATKVKMDEKEKNGIAEKRKGMRGPENVWGSGATAAICCILLSLSHQFEFLDEGLLKLAFISSIATKTSDTTASEIGKAYGKNCFLLTNLTMVPPGTEGAISLEGTSAGILASIVIGLYGLKIGYVEDVNQFMVVLVSAFVATTIESYLGATIQDDKFFTNEMINFINTSIGAIVAVLLCI